MCNGTRATYARKGSNLKEFAKTSSWNTQILHTRAHKTPQKPLLQQKIQETFRDDKTLCPSTQKKSAIAHMD